MKQKKRTGRRLLSFLLTLVMVVGLMPGMSMTVYAGSEVSYKEGSWSNNSVAYETKTATNPTTLTSDTTAWADGNWYVVPADGITISTRITVTGTANLILTDGNTLTASKGITVETGNTLNIYAQSEGNNAGVLLINDVADNNSGIGGGSKGNGGTITIHGGKITVKGGTWDGAGIGGGWQGSGGTVTFYGGEVTAAGGRHAAGIGGGGKSDENSGNGGTVTLYGGEVTATGGSNAAGIGGGEDGSGGTVTIHGGKVTATGNLDAAGIGAGNSGSGGTVTIDGGTVTATGANSRCMGIGGIAKRDMDMTEEGIKITPPQNGSLTVGNGLKIYGGDNADPTTEISQEELNKINSSQNTTVYQYMIVSGPLHEHNFTYSVNGDTITATCSDEDGCDLPEVGGKHTATLTIAAPQHTTVGDGKSEEAQITDENQLKGSATVSYYATDASSNKTGNALTEAPTEAGTYWAEITLTNGGSGANDSATAHVVYTITDPGYNVTLPTDLVGGTVTANKTSAKYGDTVTLTIEPDNGFTIKTVKYNDTAITANEGVYSFTMPAADVTVSAEFEGAPFDVTISNAITGGTVEVSSALENGKAKAGSEVTLTVNPAAGYQLETLKYNNTAITASNGVYKFTMPTETVTVTATFIGKPVTVTLNATGDGGTASLLHDDYTAVTTEKPLTKKTGEEFILCINKDEAHSYKVSFSPNATASMKEFSVEDYKAYINSTKSESLNTSLYWVTMPGVNADSVNMTVTFAEAKTFTILYQPTTSADEVWVKFGYKENNEDKLVTAKMSPDAKMGNVAVWSLKMSAAFNPDKIAFATSESGLDSAAMITNVTVSQNDEWKTITNTDDKYLIVGNNAKTVIAAFTDDSSSAVVNREASVINIGDDAKYQIAICASGGEGTVTAPAAPTKEGYTFEGWRGYKGITATDYAANTSISVKENMVFSAVWQPKNPNVKLNLDGGTGIDNTEFTVTYNTTLASLTPVKSGFSFVGWSVAKDVTEDGKVYTKGAPFDTGTKITADLELTAQWKHVHAYRCIQIGAVSSLATKYEKYAPYLHIRICGCGDVDLEAHSLDSSGRCVCGYSKPAAPSTAELNVSYGQWLNGNYTEKMAEVPENFAVNSEVSVSAPGKWGSLKFSKWQYSTNGGTSWDDLAAYTMLSFIIPSDIQLRALYVNATTVPEVSMSATTYETTASDGNLYDSILFQMNYKLPDGYTYVDAGIRSGDNAGISYYELKERRYSMDAEVKAVAYSITAVTSLFSGGPETYDTSVTEQYYAKRENSVLDEDGMDAAKLGEYMYQSKPINIQDPPLYWNYKPNTTGQSGSINALTPVGFAQRNNGDHYIYAIAWLQYKKPDGKVETIWTDAMATTLNGVPSSGSVSKTGE